MTNADFWASVRTIIAEGFTPEGLFKLDRYGEDFISGKLVYQRFSPQEQHGCATGGATNVIASLLAGAEVSTDRGGQTTFSNFQAERQCATQQETVIEQWAKRVGLWTDCVEDSLPQSLGEQIAEGGEAVVYDHGTTLIKSIGLDYFIQPIFALDRISLHNTYFPETRLTVLGFGRDKRGEFKIIAEQPYIDGQPAEYLRANYLLRAMVVPEGDHVIEFRNEAPTLHQLDNITLICSIVTLLVIAGTLFVYYRKQKK